MFQWWQNDSTGFPIERRYAHARGREIAHRFQVMDYRDLSQEMTLTARAHIFSALDQLSLAERAVVAEMWDQLKAERPQVRLLNDPRRVLTRFLLLQRLHGEGLNQFRVYRAVDAKQVARFPVFVRSDRFHTGALTGLITSADALSRAIRALRARGADVNDLMIVEYVDARDSDGFYRKYAAFRVGDRILPSHVLVHQHWMVKSEGTERSMAIADDEARFHSEGTFNEWIMRVFQQAGIDYGRLDFGVVAGVPQAWEINMQPTIGRGPGENKPRPQDDIQQAFESVRSQFHVRLRDAFVALDDEDIPEPAPLVVRMSEEAMLGLTRSRQTAERRSLVRSLLTRVYQIPGVERPLRSIFRRLLPRG